MTRRPLRKPDWIRPRVAESDTFRELKRLTKGLRLQTVCEEARCPNIYECWRHRTATFLLGGDRCTRNCRFCAVASGRPLPPDPLEPAHVAEAVKALGLAHVVITSVTRDDLPDGLAQHFALTLEAVRVIAPATRLEVLVPDFRFSMEALDRVLAARPDIFGHNLETVPRLYAQVRPGAQFMGSLELLRRAKERIPSGHVMLTKTGVMVGLGETEEELLEVMHAVRRHQVDILTLGQYLQPTLEHLPVEKYYEPEAYQRLKQMGESLGIPHVEAGPLVRSSYHAKEQLEQLNRSADKLEEGPKNLQME